MENVFKNQASITVMAWSIRFRPRCQSLLSTGEAPYKKCCACQIFCKSAPLTPTRRHVKVAPQLLFCGGVHQTSISQEHHVQSQAKLCLLLSPDLMAL